MTIAVKRALSLLNLFTESRPELGLSEAARLSGESKATVYRLLGTLCESGLVEQVAGAKTYRLGPAVLELARVREATVPLLSVVQPVLDDLLELTGETCHFTRFNGQAMGVVTSAESRKVHRITMQGVESLPVDTTAAGQVFLAFADPGLVQAVLPQIAPGRADRVALESKISLARSRGYAIVEFFEDEQVFGMAAPVFGSDQFAFGALAVIVPPNRMTPEIHQTVLRGILDGARSITAKIGGRAPT